MSTILAFGQDPASDVVINEFMASNTTVVADQDGEFDDWIELYNKGSVDINLTGYFLSDKADNLDKYDFPEGTVIPADGYLIVWADEDGSQEGIHANFKLSAAGEDIFLVNPNMEVIDEITFGEQTTDLSMARHPNGTGEFTIGEATFDANNDGPTILKGIDFETHRLEVFPNPALSHVTIHLTDATTREMEIKIIDVLGRVIFEQTTDEVKASIQVSQLSAGLYFVIANNIVGQKLVIAK